MPNCVSLNIRSFQIVFFRMSVALARRLIVFVVRRPACSAYQTRGLYKRPSLFRLPSFLAPKSSGSKGPYGHVVQVGDPVLRTKAEDVDLNKLSSPEVKFVLRCLKRSLDNYDALGVSAPQIGVPLRIFAIQVEVLKTNLRA